VIFVYSAGRVPVIETFARGSVRQDSRPISHLDFIFFVAGALSFPPYLHLPVVLEAWCLDYRNVCTIPYFHRTIPLALFPRDVKLFNLVSSSLAFLRLHSNSFRVFGEVETSC